MPHVIILAKNWRKLENAMGRDPFPNFDRHSFTHFLVWKPLHWYKILDQEILHGIKALSSWYSNVWMATSSMSFSLSASNLRNLISIVSVKLNATNYLIWQMQIFPLIQSLKLMNHLTDDAPKPKILKESGESIPNSKFDEWVNIDLLLCS